MTETEWGRLIKGAMECTGVEVVSHQMGRNVSHVADKSWISHHGNWFVEYKGPRTKVSVGQKLWHRKINARYKCAVVLRRTTSGGAQLELADGTFLGILSCPVDYPDDCLREMADYISDWRKS